MLTLEKQEEVCRFAETLYARSPDWVTFFREILGAKGVVRRLFPARDALMAFEQTEAYQQIQQMLTALRRNGPTPPDPSEPTRVITVRLPKSVHDALKAEAHEHQTSMNKLCITKLMQFIENGASSEE